MLSASLLGWILGTAVQLQFQSLHAPWLDAVALAISFLAFVGFATRNTGHWVRLPACALAAAVMALAVTGLRASAFEAQGLNPQLEGADLVITGVVDAMPQTSEAGLRFRLDVESAHVQGEPGAGQVARPVQLPPRIYLNWYSGPRAASTGGIELQRQPGSLSAGERWQFTARLKAPHGGSNPHGFDFELWLWEQGLQATGYVRAGPKDSPPKRLGTTWQHPVERARQAVRDRIFEHVKDKKQAGVIAALVVGDQSAIDRADWDVFRATGVAHLMSISGLHVTMFAWVAMLAVRSVWRRSSRLCFALPAPTAGLIGGVVLALLYALFSGWGVPAQRTVLMLAVVSLLRIGARRWPWPQVWILVCAVVVAVDPWALLQGGFWLSFVAVGILFATDTGRVQAQPADPSKRRFALVLRKAAGLLREQWIITLALAPLTLLLFGQVSLVGLVANLVAIPWVTLVVTPLAMFGAAFSGVWWGGGWAIDTLARILAVLAALPFATVSIARAPLWAGAAGVFGGILLAMRLPWSLRLLGLPLLLPVLLWRIEVPAAGEFELLAADVGQGNAVIVRTAKHALLYDAGPRFSRESDAGHRVLVPLLRALDVKLDTVVLSHRDADHTGGALAVLAMQPQAQLISSIEDQHDIQAVRKATRCVAGQQWQWDGVDFLVLHPEPEDYASSAKSNALSCVLKVSNGRQSALLTGDISGL